MNKVMNEWDVVLVMVVYDFMIVMKLGWCVKGKF